MSKWQILGIVPTNDQRQIKKAYAVKLKQLDVEADPQGFQALKEAFDEALAEAKSGGSIPQQADESLEFQEQPVTDGLSEALWRVAPVEMAESQETTIPEPQIATFTETFQGFLAQMTYFDDLSGWQELLQTVNQLPIEAYGDAREELAAFFDYHYQILSKQVQDLLITQFDLLGADSRYDESFKKHLQRYPASDFSFAETIDKTQRENYFWARSRLYDMVNYGKHQLPDFPQELATTRQIFAFDLSLDLIEAWYLVRTDFRLIDPVKSRRLQELIMKQSAGPERVILQDYLLTVKGQNPRRPDFTLIREFLAKYPPVPDQIPVSVYRLMGGYLNYLMKEREQVQFFWKGYEEQYGYGYFNPTEQKFLPQESQVAAAPKKKNFLWIGVAVGIMMVFMPVIRGIMGGYRSTPTPRQVITPPSVELPSFEEQLKDATQDPAIAEKYQNSDEISKRFFFYFYLDQDNEGREAFITSEMAGKAQEQARALTADQVAPQVVTSQINLITLKEETDQGTLYFLRNFSMQAMLQKVPNSILLVKDGKIQEVYSTEWGTDEATFNALADQIKAANQESTDETEMPLEEQL